MLSLIQKVLDKRNPFNMSVDDVLAVAKIYSGFKVVYDQPYSRPDEYHVVGYKTFFNLIFGRYDILLTSTVPGDALYMVDLFRIVIDLRDVNKLVKEVGISE